MSEVNIERWIDMDSADFQRLERPIFLRKIITIGVEAGIYKLDKAGYMWKDGKPVYAELDGGYVGLRFSAKAVN